MIDVKLLSAAVPIVAGIILLCCVGETYYQYSKRKDLGSPVGHPWLQLSTVLAAISLFFTAFQLWWVAISISGLAVASAITAKVRMGK